MLGMVVHACNLSTQEADARGFLHSVQGNPGLQSEIVIQRNPVSKKQTKKETPGVVA